MKSEPEMQAASVTISVVCPCFNEEKVIPAFIDALIPVLKDTDLSYEIVFINDGSSDKTLQALLAVREETDAVRILNLSRNFGKEAAMTAGLDHAQGEVIIPMDVDLQDPPELIKEFIERWREGYEVVLARRVDRSADTWTKRVSAGLFYHLHNRISDVEVPHNVGDYRLFTRKVLKEVQRLGEHQRFMKGLFAWVGFNTTTVEYVREKRVAGKTHFNGWKLWNFALDGITSFSSAPLRIWLYIGICIATPSVFWASWILIRTVVYGIDLPGYASLISAVLFLGGIQLIGIGVLGEYVGRIYIETKGRPNYIVEKDYETRPSI